MSRPLEERITIPGPVGGLEALLHREPGADTVAVICHPHPLHGGAMQNKVVHTLQRAARDLGVHTLRFNFRGVGKSAGDYADGAGETEDCLAAIAWVQAELQVSRLWLLGFSFGGFVAAAAASGLAAWPQRLLLVAPSVERMPFADLLPLAGPATVFVPEADDVVSPVAVRHLLSGEPGVQLQEFAGAGHFFHGQLVELKAAAQAMLQGTG
ncbi:MAG: alpha/beta fold hydrolase [Pseudomonadaceae bacterium]|nr:MAG: alpha/beta fold hydrolase [Pseudomonadaceae bacterium]